MIRKQMFRHSSQFKCSALLLALTLLALPSFAQRREPAPAAKPAAKKIIFQIMEVKKKDAEPQQVNGQRAVPVDVRRLVKVPTGTKLLEIKAVLETRNTDGRTSRGEAVWTALAEDFTSIVMLPMEEGVFAKDFTLTLIAKTRILDRFLDERVTKSGTFPVPALAEKK